MGSFLVGLFQQKHSLPGLTEEELARNSGLIAGKCGFYRFDVSLTAAAGAGSRRKYQAMVFHLLNEAEPCPCGSGDAFGDCCRPLGPVRVFTLDPGGESYSPLAFYSEVWEPCPVAWDKMRDVLQRHKEFVIAVDSPANVYWNYLGEKTVTSGPGPMVFGTVELTSDCLKIEGTSRLRHKNLRARLEQVLAAPLPSGKLEISLPDRNGSVISSGMLLEEYRRLRKRLRELFSAAGREIMRDEYQSAAKDLRMLGPGQTIIFDDENDSSLLTDYGLFDLKRHGKTIIQHFMQKNPAASEDDQLLYQACAKPLVSIFQVEEIASGALNLNDLLTPGRKILLMDYNLSQCVKPGLILFMRLLPLPQFAMGSGGWGYAVDATQKEEILAKYAAVVGDATPRTRTAQGILLFKAHAKPFGVSSALP